MQGTERRLGAGVRRALWAILAVGVVVGFLVGTQWYAFVGDDSYISFRYARHLVEGHGLVWNEGERVEGYTNLLWVLLMAAGMLVGLAPQGLSQALGIACGAGVLVMVFRQGVKRFGVEDPWVWAAPVLLVGSRSFLGWSTGGLETMCFTFLVVAGILRHVEERDDPFAAWWGSSVLLALATLTRPEGGLFTAVVGCAFLLDVVRGRRRMGALVRWTLPWFAIFGAQMLFRLVYYRDVVPNTFHAKVNGVWWEQGLTWWSHVTADELLLMWAPFALIPVFASRRPYRDGLITAAILGYGVYVAMVGGDRFEFRFWVPILPLVALQAADGLSPARWVRFTGLGPGVAWTVAGAIVLGTVVGRWPLHLDDRAEIVDAIERLPLIEAYAERRARQGQWIRELVDEGHLSEDTRLCMRGAGALPYEADLWTLDYFGLNNRHVKRQRVDGRGVVAHEHEAPLPFIAKHRVHLFDTTGRPVVDNEGQAEKVMDDLKRVTRRRDPEGEVLRTACLHPRDDRWLLFSTAVDDAEFARVFADVPGCGLGEQLPRRR